MTGDYGPDHDPEAEAEAEVRDWLEEWSLKLSGESKEIMDQVIEEYDRLSGTEREDLPLESTNGEETSDRGTA